VFVVSVFGATMLFGLILFVLKCLEKRRSSASVTAAGDGQRPTADDHTVTILLQPDGESQAVPRGGKRWRVKLSELLQQIGLLSATSRQSQFDDVLPSA